MRDACTVRISIHKGLLEFWQVLQSSGARVYPGVKKSKHVPTFSQ